MTVTILKPQFGQSHREQRFSRMWDTIAEENKRLRTTLTKVRNSFIYVDDHSDAAVMQEAKNHHFDEMCATLRSNR